MRSVLIKLKSRHQTAWQRAGNRLFLEVNVMRRLAYVNPYLELLRPAVGSRKAVAKASAPAPRPKPKARAAAVEMDLDDDGPSPYAHLDSPPPFPRAPARVAPQPVEPAFRRRGREFAQSMELAAAQAEGRKPRDLIPGPVQGVTKISGADLLRVLEDENARKRDRR